MMDRIASKLNRSGRLWTVGGSLLNASLLIAITINPSAYAQAAVTASPLPSPDSLAFEVASVRQNKTDEKPSMNVSPTTGDSFTPTGGLYAARNIALVSYIAFAYKLTNKQLQAVVTQVPWAMEERFDIEARAEGNPTKDQHRSMMRSVLSQRFQLAVHFETRNVPVFMLVLAKPGKLGPQLRLHSLADPECAAPESAPIPDNTTGGAAEDAEGFAHHPCGAIVRMKPSGPGRMREGARDVPMTLIAAILTGVGNVERPMFDQTGIKGNVDFNLEWGLVRANLPVREAFHPDDSAATFQEALQEQLGIKMLAKKGPADFFIVDHIEQPSPN